MVDALKELVDLMATAFGTPAAIEQAIDAAGGDISKYDYHSGSAQVRWSSVLRKAQQEAVLIRFFEVAQEHYQAMDLSALRTAVLQSDQGPPAPSPEERVVQLDRESRKELLAAFLAAFPRRADVQRMVKLELDENLEVIASSEGTLVDTWSALIAWAESNDRVEDLIKGARAANAGNTKLAHVAARILAMKAKLER